MGFYRLGRRQRMYYPFYAVQRGNSYRSQPTPATRLDVAPGNCNCPATRASPLFGIEHDDWVSLLCDIFRDDDRGSQYNLFI
jgi:hypothetical protein